MTRLVVDDSLPARLRGVASVVELCDETGQVVGYFCPVWSNGPAPRSPFTDEEIQRRRQEKTGRPWAEALRDLGRP
jgi:hypothetical protein